MLASKRYSYTKGYLLEVQVEILTALAQITRLFQMKSPSSTPRSFQMNSPSSSPSLFRWSHPPPPPTFSHGVTLLHPSPPFQIQSPPSNPGHFKWCYPCPPLTFSDGVTLLHFSPPPPPPFSFCLTRTNTVSCIA